MKRKIAVVFGVLGGISIVLSVFLTYRLRFFPSFAFCSLAVFSTYIFLIYSHSRIAALSALLCHVTAIAALVHDGSMAALSVPYIMLPFLALMVRNIFMEKLAHTLKLWLEPLLFFIAVTLYAAEWVLNTTLPTDAKLFPLAFFLANGFMIFDVLLDGLKIKKRVKKGQGLAAGETAPLFCLQNEQDQQVCLSDFKGKHHVLLIFVRGEWCPMCNIMLRTYMKESAKFKEKNVFLLVIGPDPTGVNKKMAEELKLDFHILSDTGLNITHLYRLKIKAEHLLHADNYNTEKEIPLPASFLIDKAGIIRYSSKPEKIGEVVKLTDIFPILQTLDNQG